MLTIRSATVNDAQTIATLNMAVQQLHHEARPGDFKPPSDGTEMVQYFRDILESRDDNRLLIGEINGEAMGYIFVRIFRSPESAYSFAVDAAYIDQMAVRPDHHGQGYGKRLVEAVVDLARSQGCSRVTLNVWLFNTGALGFYEKLGFSVMSQAMELRVDG